MTPRELVLAHVANPTVATRNAVVAAYYHLCLRGARRFARATTDRADLIQVAAIGLIKAASKYQARSETPFEAYAWSMIIGELMHYARDHERPVRVPRAVRALERPYLAAWESLAAEHGREPTRPEIARTLAVSEVAIEALVRMRNGSDIVPFEGLERSGEAGIAAPSDDRLDLERALGELAERERVAIVAMFEHDMTQTEIGKRLGISQSQVSKIVTRALQKMRERVA